ncbi:uncharacterized protein SETTUDRAFT_20225 [Exserohilum turcica Et28A]|uniref:Uncharacterized protein n=1 Tax=Exserohilum turcicum (strain 28A) TaxID=671987 RepID=R0JUK1_EXST2|nr:uncharacterized protein SETTUDRAFT_20225 [Exserohilum turcica Et28A]EOA84698.1 hypothetical protein SETTUDRAFT_20225 [Exserohilum turcica Et28A]
MAALDVPSPSVKDVFAGNILAGDIALLSMERCTTVYSDQTEEEAYWAEVEENAILGAAGFREPGEHYVHWQSD